MGPFALAAMWTMGASTFMNTVGAYTQQRARNKQLRYQAQVARNNATIAKYEGRYAKEAAQRKATKQQKIKAGVISKQRAAMGASGLVADEGSFLDLTLDTAELGKLDELAILHEGDIEAWKSEITEKSAEAQAGMFEASRVSPFLAATSALMTGVAQTGMGYAALK
jgi:hypothetical protein